MCGIAGYFNHGTASQELISKMIAIIRYRGPDEAGAYIDSSITLGHCRLSIVGLDSGIQPICNEDGTLWIVYNGEIFNYPELREELLSKGHVFSTATDTEVIIHLYEEYGQKCLAMLNGQFAFAIWDSTIKELFLARDRVGIRPLYYYQAGNDFIFSSEIKALFVHSSIPREIDRLALYQIFTYWTTAHPKTTFKDVYELPPGHYQVVRNGCIVKQEPYWNIPYYPPEHRWPGTFDDAVEELRFLLRDAIRLRLRADVPVGAYLSGGLDSSIITALISRHFNNRLRTFSIGFQEADFDETDYQQELVQHLGTEHSERLVSNQDIRDNFPQVIHHCEKPVLRTAPVPMYLLSKMVRDNQFKVVLTGEGADEVFGGYDIFKEVKIRQFWSKFPQSSSRPRLIEKLHPYIFTDPGRSRMMLQKFYATNADELPDPLFSHRIRWNTSGKNRMFFSDATTRQIIEENYPESDLIRHLPVGFDARDPFAKTQYLEMNIFLSNYLLSSQGDRVAMGNSVELRVPFLDYRVIDFAAQLRPSWKMRALNEKHLLKKAFQAMIPQRIVARSKHPYRAPIREVFFSGACGYVEELLSAEYLHKTGYFNPEKTGRLIDKFRNRDQLMTSESQNMALVGILSTQLLHQQFIDEFQCAASTRFDRLIDRSSGRKESP